MEQRTAVRAEVFPSSDAAAQRERRVLRKLGNRKLKIRKKHLNRDDRAGVHDFQRRVLEWGIGSAGHGATPASLAPLPARVEKLSDLAEAM